MATIYSVPEQYAGKSIKQLAQGGFDPNVIMSGEELARQLGVGYETPLQSGQTFNTSWNDTGHGDYQLLKYLNPQDSATYYQNQQTEAMNKAIQPAVSSLQQGIPLVQQQYGQQASYLQSQVDPLKQRYDSLLNQLTGKETSQLNQNTLALSKEFGKRGVPLSSGAYDQSLLQTLGPIQQYYAGLMKDTSLARESDLGALSQQIAMNPIEMAQAVNQIQNAIASLQAGAGKDAISNALNMTQFQTSIEQQNKQLAQAMKIAEMENAVKGAVSPTDEAYRKAQTDYLMAQIANLNAKTTNLGNGGNTGNEDDALNTIFGNDSNTNYPTYFQPLA